jgi:hypothetical protein
VIRIGLADPTAVVAVSSAVASVKLRGATPLYGVRVASWRWFRLHFVTPRRVSFLRQAVQVLCSNRKNSIFGQLVFGAGPFFTRKRLSLEGNLLCQLHGTNHAYGPGDAPLVIQGCSVFRVSE